MFRKSALLFVSLLSAISHAQTGSPPTKPVIHRGEIEIEGKLSRVDPAHGTAVVQVTTVTLPDGSVSYYTIPRVKQISFPSQSTETDTSTVLMNALHTGFPVRVVGQNSGDGNTLPARIIAVAPPAAPTLALEASQATDPMAKIEHPYALTAMPPVAPIAEGQLGAALIDFCRRNLGRQVGNGQCAALPDSALRAIGAHGRFADFPGNEDYVWGRLIYAAELRNGHAEEGGSLSNVKVGDVIQYRNVVCETAKGSFYNRSMLIHHTAVIDGISMDGMTFSVLQQNDGGRLYVTRGSFRLADVKAGWFRIYRAVPPTPKSALFDTTAHGAANTGNL